MIAIIGAGGHGKCALECFVAAGEKLIGFYDDDSSLHGATMIGSYGVLGSPSIIEKTPGITAVFVAIGNNKVRRQKFEYFRTLGYRIPNAVHPSVYTSRFCQLGKGLFIMGAAVVNAHATIEDYAIVNTSATIDHDCIVGQAAQVAPGVNMAGGSKLGAGAFVGIGARVAPGVRIGEDAIIGAGSVVLQDIPSEAFAYGIPAKLMRRRPTGPW